ncbi:hypothetical protein B0H19DRAFT_1384319 [Mycena capillaripes]|nr:hypothetical protein B0H19DRAFT_1384319 [Mycena capillaripes]
MSTKRRRSDLRLPQELIDAIVFELRDNTSSLTACSKTARTFRVPCQRRIFRQLVLHNEESGYSNNFRRASDLLTSSPHLETYVHDLTSAWPIQSKDMRRFESVLRALHNVQRFTISNNGSFVGWNTIPLALASTIFDFISLPTLDRLHLIGICDVPFSLINHAISSVRVLSLDIYADHGVMSASIPPSPSQIRLEHLILLHSRTTFYLRHLLCMLNREGYFRNTGHLILPLEQRDDDDRALFESLPVTLRHLEIEFGLTRGIVTIPKLAHLQVLELGFYIGLSRVLPDTLDLFVSNIPELTPLVESITFTFEIMPRIPEIPWASNQPWPVFDVGFMQRGDLPRLRRVTCCLQLKMQYFHGDSNVSYVGFVAAMEGKFLGLTGTDMLAFTKGTRPHHRL